jgi:DNA-directed RNA polymerase subunit RPC12/RpoP
MDDLADGDKKPAAIDTSGGGAVINKTLYKCRKCKNIFWTSNAAVAHESTCSEESWINCTVCSIFRFKTNGERLIHEKTCKVKLEPIMIADLPGGAGLRATRPPKEDVGEDDDIKKNMSPDSDSMEIPLLSKSDGGTSHSSIAPIRTKKSNADVLMCEAIAKEARHRLLADTDEESSNGMKTKHMIAPPKRLEHFKTIYDGTTTTSNNVFSNSNNDNGEVGGWISTKKSNADILMCRLLVYLFVNHGLDHVDHDCIDHHRERNVGSPIYSIFDLFEQTPSYGFK